VRVRNAEPLTVAFLKHEVLPDLGGDALQMLRVQGQASLVRFSGAGEDAEGEVAGHAGHFFLGLAGLVTAAFSPELGGAAAAFLSARFSLMVLDDFLDAVWRGDLSAMYCSCSGTDVVPDFERYRYPPNAAPEPVMPGTRERWIR
jgi:hypothetical protein